MFINILENLCKSKNTTVTTVLKELNISTSKGTAWRTGSVPNGIILLELADYFNVSTDYLLGREQPAVSTAVQFSENELELLKHFRQLTERNQLKALGRVEEVLSTQKESEQTVEKVG